MGDKINQFSVVEPTIRRMKRARVAKFKGGHAAFLEQPELFVRQFQTFIDETNIGHDKVKAGILERRSVPEAMA